MAESTILPRIRLMMGPGTLPSRGDGRMDMTRYRKSGEPQMTGAELLAAVPEIAGVARAEAESRGIHGIATIDDLRRLSLAIDAELASPATDAVVFVQGTNSIEETAYFLHLTLKSAKPVVITGAQRPFTALSSDAPLNLHDAFRVAACPQTRGKGVVVVTNGEINSARDVTKTHTYRRSEEHTSELQSH